MIRLRKFEQTALRRVGAQSKRKYFVSLEFAGPVALSEGELSLWSPNSKNLFVAKGRTMATLASRPLSWFQVHSQVRQQIPVEEAELRRLGESLQVKQLQPVLAKPTGELIAGERRLRAAQLVGLTELMVVITDEPISESELRIFQLTENIHRSDLTDSEKWRACEELLRLNPDWTNKDLAAHLKLSESTVTKYLSPSRCLPDVQQAIEAGQIGITTAYEISRVPADQQAELLQMTRNGASREVLSERIRKQKRTAVSPTRSKRIICPLPSGVVVTASGAELSLDDMLDSLRTAQKEVLKAIDQGLDAKTFTAVMKDKAKKGGA